MSNVPMTRAEEALAIHFTPYFHSSTFVELESGAILHAAGTTFTTSDDGGLTWSEPFEYRDTDGNPVGGGGTSLVRLSGSGIGLAGMGGRREAPLDETLAEKAKRQAEDRGRTHTMFWRSPDQGKTWEPPVRITPVGIIGHAYQDVLLRTSSGRIVLPVYGSLGQNTGPNDEKPPASGKIVNNQWISTGAHFFDPHFSYVYVMYSDDDGRTWQRNSDGELVILQDPNATFSYVNEPTVTEVTPGTLLMMMRTALGRIYQAWSYNDGETWTRPQPTSLASSTAPCQVRTLPNGHLLAVWNQEGEEEVKRGFNRTRVSSAISRNGGSVWEFFQNVESIHEETRVEPPPIRPLRPAEHNFEPGVPAPEREVEHVKEAKIHGRWSYPSVFVMKDRVLITHTHTLYQEHPTKAQTMALGGQAARNMRPDKANQQLKVLPLSWFYGGKEPADSPVL